MLEGELVKEERERERERGGGGLKIFIGIWGEVKRKIQAEEGGSYKCWCTQWNVVTWTSRKESASKDLQEGVLQSRVRFNPGRSR